MRAIRVAVLLTTVLAAVLSFIPPASAGVPTQVPFAHTRPYAQAPWSTDGWFFNGHPLVEGDVRVEVTPEKEIESIGYADVYRLKVKVQPVARTGVEGGTLKIRVNSLGAKLYKAPGQPAVYVGESADVRANCRYLPVSVSIGGRVSVGIDLSRIQWCTNGKVTHTLQGDDVATWQISNLKLVKEVTLDYLVQVQPGEKPGFNVHTTLPEHVCDGDFRKEGTDPSRSGELCKVHEDRLEHKIVVPASKATPGKTALAGEWWFYDDETRALPGSDVDRGGSTSRSGDRTGLPGSGGGGGGTAPAPKTSPVGAFDAASARLGGTVEVSGWAYDPDAPKEPVAIHVYVGGPAGAGIGHNLGPASLSRPDVATAYPAAGADHGFSRTITGVPAGKQTIYVYAINVGAGTNTLIGTRDVTIATGKPFGYLDGAVAARDGAAQLDGWAIDPDDPTEPVAIHVYVDGPAGVSKVGHNLGPAGNSRPDVATAHPGAGDRHGFSTKISGLGPGKHTLYFYAINIGPGDHALLGTRDVVVPVELPFGVLDIAAGRFMGEAHVFGWAIDPESPGFEAHIHVYVDGPAGSGALGFNLFGAALSRPDVGAAYPGRGNNHGFDRVLTGLSAGKHTLYVYAVGAAGHKLLASRQITVGAGVVGAGGAAVPTSDLQPDRGLLPGQGLLSPSRQYALIMQGDGNLVIYHVGGAAVWHTSTFQAGSFVAMQGDGNFVIYTPAGRPVWATMTNGKSGAVIVLQDDGNLVIYKNGVAQWSRFFNPGVRLM